LLILSESISKQREPEEPITAIDRYTGVFFKVFKKFKRERSIKNIDLIIISQRYGVIKSTTKIPYYEVTPASEGGFGQRLSLREEEIKNLLVNNLKSIQKITEKGKYSRIIVCVGQSYLRLIQGFEDQTKAEVIHVTGKGLGPKARNLSDILTS